MPHQQLTKTSVARAEEIKDSTIDCITGKLADTPTCALPARGQVSLRTGQLMDWTSRGLDSSGISQVAD